MDMRPFVLSGMVLLTLGVALSVNASSAADTTCLVADPSPKCGSWTRLGLSSSEKALVQSGTAVSKSVEFCLHPTLSPGGTFSSNSTPSLTAEQCRDAMFTTLSTISGATVASLNSESLVVIHSSTVCEGAFLATSSSNTSTNPCPSKTIDDTTTAYLSLRDNFQGFSTGTGGLCTDSVFCGSQGTASLVGSGTGCNCTCNTGIESCAITDDLASDGVVASAINLPTDQIGPRIVGKGAPELTLNFSLFSSSDNSNQGFVATPSVNADVSIMVLSATKNQSEKLTPSLISVYYQENGTLPITAATNPSVLPQAIEFDSASNIGAMQLMDVQNTVLDLGWLAKEEDFSITLWLKVDTSTRGVVYCVADHVSSKSTDTYLPFIVEELDRVYLNEFQSSEKRTTTNTLLGSTFRIYSAVQVDGSLNRIQFLYSNSREPQLNRLIWTRPELFDGEWHYVALRSRSYSGRRSMQLYLDGFSEDRGPEWRDCFSDSRSNPEPIRSVLPGNLPVPNALTDKVYLGGTAYLGAVSAGKMSVWDLTFHDKLLTRTQIIKRGEAEMERHLFVRKAESWGLGFSISVVLLTGIILILIFHHDKIRVPNRKMAEEDKAVEEWLAFEKELDAKRAAGKKIEENENGEVIIEDDSDDDDGEYDDDESEYETDDEWVGEDGEGQEMSEVNKNNNQPDSDPATTTTIIAGDSGAQSNNTNPLASPEEGRTDEGETEKKSSSRGSSKQGSPSGSRTSSRASSVHKTAADVPAFQTENDGGESDPSSSAPPEGTLLTVVEKKEEDDDPLAGAGGVATAAQKDPNNHSLSSSQKRRKKKAERGKKRKSVKKRKKPKRLRADRAVGTKSGNGGHPLSKLDAIIPMAFMVMQSITLYFSGFDWPPLFVNVISIGTFWMTFDINLATPVVGPVATTAIQYTLALAVLLGFFSIRHRDHDDYVLKVIRREEVKRKKDRTPEEEQLVLGDVPKPASFPTPKIRLSLTMPDDEDNAWYFTSESNFTVDSMLNFALQKGLKEFPAGIVVPLQMEDKSYITVFGGQVREGAKEENTKRTDLGTFIYARGVRTRQPKDESEVFEGQIDMGVNPRYCPLHKCLLMPYQEQHHGQAELKKDGSAPYSCYYSDNKLFRRIRGPLCSDDLYTCPVDSCGYTACSVCFAPSAMNPKEVSHMAWTTKKYNFKKQGIMSIIGLITIVIAEAIFLPTLKTAFLILSCHPQYMCNYPHCFAEVDAEYIVAGAFSFLMIFMYGFGLIFIEWHMIFKRKFAIVDSGLWNKHLIPPQKMLAGKWPLCLCFPALPDDEDDDDDPNKEPWVPTTFFEKAFCGMELDVWQGILANDSTMLRGLYEPLRFEQMWIHPLYLVFRGAIAGAVLLLTSNTFYQLVAAACVETTQFWLFTATSALMDPWVDILARSGSLHNLAQLMLICFHRVIVAEDPEDNGLASVMLTLTFCYLVFLIFVIIKVVINPILEMKRAEKEKREAERQKRLREAEKVAIANKKKDRVAKFHEALAIPQHQMDRIKKGIRLISSELIVEDAMEEPVSDLLEVLSGLAETTGGTMKSLHPTKGGGKLDGSLAPVVPAGGQESEGAATNSEGAIVVQVAQPVDEDEDDLEPIRKLAFHRTLRGIHIPLFAPLLSLNSELTVLDLSLNRLTNANLAYVVEAACRSKSLKQLLLRGVSTGLDVRLANALKKFCSSNEHCVEELDFSQNCLVGKSSGKKDSLFQLAPGGSLTKISLDQLSNPGKTEKMRLKNYEDVSSELAKMLSMNKGLLKHFSLNKVSYSDYKMGEIFAQMTKEKNSGLESLSLSGCGMTDPAALIKWLDACGGATLQKLDISANSLTFEQLQKVIKSVASSCPKMEELNVAKCCPVDGEDEQILKSFLPEGSDLASKWKLVEITDKPLVAFLEKKKLSVPVDTGLSLEMLKDFPITKKKIDTVELLGRNGIQSLHLQTLFEQDVFVNNLTKLYIPNNGIGDKLVNTLVPLITGSAKEGEEPIPPRLPSLHSLDISGNQLTGKAIGRLVKSFPANRMRKLKLSENELALNNFKTLGNFLKNSSASMMTLNLGYCKISGDFKTDEVVSAFSEDFLPGVRACASLEEIVIAGLPLNLACMKSFVQNIAGGGSGPTKVTVKGGKSEVIDVKCLLKRIDISDLDSKDMRRTDAAVTIATEVVSRCKTLQELKAANLVADSGRLAKACITAPALQRLCVSGCTTGNDGNVRWENTKVNFLDLSSLAQCGLPTAQSIARAVGNDKCRLNELKLSTGDAPAKAFLKVLVNTIEKNQSLTEIDLRYEKALASGKTEYVDVTKHGATNSQIKNLAISLGSGKELRRRTIAILAKLVAYSTHLKFIRTPDILSPEEKSVLLQAAKSNTTIRSLIENENPLDPNTLTMNPFAKVDQRNQQLGYFVEYYTQAALESLEHHQDLSSAKKKEEGGDSDACPPEDCPPDNENPLGGPVTAPAPSDTQSNSNSDATLESDEETRQREEEAAAREKADKEARELFTRNRLKDQADIVSDVTKQLVELKLEAEQRVNETSMVEDIEEEPSSPSAEGEPGSLNPAGTVAVTNKVEEVDDEVIEEAKANLLAVPESRKVLRSEAMMIGSVSGRENLKGQDEHNQKLQAACRVIEKIIRGNIAPPDPSLDSTIENLISNASAGGGATLASSGVSPSVSPGTNKDLENPPEEQEEKPKKEGSDDEDEETPPEEEEEEEDTNAGASAVLDFLSGFFVYLEHQRELHRINEMKMKALEEKAALEEEEDQDESESSDSPRPADEGGNDNEQTGESSAVVEIVADGEGSGQQQEETTMNEDGDEKGGTSEPSSAKTKKKVSVVGIQGFEDA